MATEDEIRHRLLVLGLATGPATSAEIDTLAAQLQVCLPVTYRAYLRCCGRNPPKQLIGSDCTIDCVVENIAEAHELFRQNGLTPPQEPFVVFCLHQGYYLEYFVVDGTDDPAVYSYVEGDSQTNKVSEHLSQWIAGLTVNFPRH